MGLIPLGFWAASGAGGAPTSAAYELISTTVLGSAAASVTFSGLGTSAAAYKHLQIRYVVAETAGGDLDTITMRFNGDAGTNYSFHSLHGQGSSVASTGAGSSNTQYVGYVNGNGYAAYRFGAGIIDILDFASTTKNKTTRSLSGATGPTLSGVTLKSNAWYSTAAITSIVISGLSGNLDINSRFSLYGLK